MNKKIGITIGVLLALLVAAGVWSYQENGEEAENLSSESPGALYVGVTDATAEIANVNDIELSVRKVEVYSASDGWVSVGSNEKEYNLLDLKARGATEFYAEKDDMKPGVYDRVRVTLGDATVKTKTGKDVEAAMPASEFVINTSVKVAGGQNSHLTLDFLADKSLHSTSDGQYVFAPVVETESRSGTVVRVDADDTVVLEGGTVDSTAKTGMDLNGNSRAGFELVTDNTLRVDSDAGAQIKFILGGETYTPGFSEDTERSDEEGPDAKVEGSTAIDADLIIN